MTEAGVVADRCENAPTDELYRKVYDMNKVQSWLALTAIIVAFGALGAEPAYAQGGNPPANATNTIGMGLKVLGGGLGAGIVLIGVGLGIGRIGGSAVEAMARQPEAAGTINTAMLITAAMVEGAGLFGVLGCFLALLK